MFRRLGLRFFNKRDRKKPSLKLWNNTLHSQVTVTEKWKVCTGDIVSSNITSSATVCRLTLCYLFNIFTTQMFSYIFHCLFIIYFKNYSKCYIVRDPHSQRSCLIQHDLSRTHKIICHIVSVGESENKLVNG